MSFFLVLQAFIFKVKNILFSGWRDPKFFEVPHKYADKEVKRLRELRRSRGMGFGRKMTPDKKKIPLLIGSLMLTGLLFVASNLYFYYKNYFCFHLN